MKISLRPGYEPEMPTTIPDVRVIIDVFRASTTTLAILENGAQSLFIANDFDLLKTFSEDGYLIVSEVFDLGIDNSPTLVKSNGVLNRKVVLKTSNLTTALEKNISSKVIIACFNNLGAVFDHLMTSQYQDIEIIPAGHMADHQMNFEDLHCAEILKGSLKDRKLLVPNKSAFEIRIDEIFKSKPRPQHYIEDLNLAIKPNISKSVPAVIKRTSALFDVRLQGD